MTSVTSTVSLQAPGPQVLQRDLPPRAEVHHRGQQTRRREAVLAHGISLLVVPGGAAHISGIDWQTFYTCIFVRFSLQKRMDLKNI